MYAGIAMQQRLLAINQMNNLTEQERLKLTERLNSNEAMFSILSPEHVHKISSEQSDMIIACNFHGQSCDDNFRLHTHSI